MAGQHLDPSNDITVEQIQEKAVRNKFSRFGEMFSALNMSRLAEESFHCQATHTGDCWSRLTSLKSVVQTLCIDENLILVPYDSDHDMQPCMVKGQKAHWGVILGVAFVLPYRNKAFKNATVVDGYISYMKPPMTEKDMNYIIKAHVNAVDDEDSVRLEEPKYLLIVRQSKSKRLFLFNPNLLAQSNGNLAEFSSGRKHEHLNYCDGGFVLPESGVSGGLRGQLVLLKSKPREETPPSEGNIDEDDEYEYEEYEEETEVS